MAIDLPPDLRPMKDRLFVVLVDGMGEAFVEAKDHSKAKAKAARSLCDANFAYGFWQAIKMIKSCRLSDEPRFSPHVCEHLICP